MTNELNELDCIVSADNKEIWPVSCFWTLDDLKQIAARNPKKWRLANYEKANAQMNKNLTPIIVDGRNIYGTN